MSDSTYPPPSSPLQKGTPSPPTGHQGRPSSDRLQPAGPSKTASADRERAESEQFFNRNIGPLGRMCGPYLNTHTAEEGAEFFRIAPDTKRRRAVLAKPAPVRKSHLRAV